MRVLKDTLFSTSTLLVTGGRVAFGFSARSVFSRKQHTCTAAAFATTSFNNNKCSIERSICCTGRRRCPTAHLRALHATTGDSYNDSLVELQKTTARSEGKAKIDNLADHISHQRETFDAIADFSDSDEATPDDVRPILQRLVGRALARMVESVDVVDEESSDSGDDDDESSKSKTREYRVLDVGCGTGALFPYYAEAADAMGVTLSVTGIDLSSSMADVATSNAADLMTEEKDAGHMFDVIMGDFVELVLGKGYEDLNDGVGFENEETEPYRGKFDAVVVNACFGNFFDSYSLLAACSQSLAKDGVVCITHPLGSGFVEKLHRESPDTVPNVLPSPTLLEDLCLTLPLEALEFVGGDSETDGEYFACAKRTPHAALPKVMRFRGAVANGYGRGGKKLGFPTANLPSSLFSEALVDVRTGVYFGWALIEDDTTCSNDSETGPHIHKAVVNVGFSPTFEGSENVEKIIEAHLMPDDELDDFYGQEMRLVLVGRLRHERKFPSFPDLVAAINNDVLCAKAALDIDPFAKLKNDVSMNDGDKTRCWVGKDGGDEEASWEFQEIREVLSSSPSS